MATVPPSQPGRSSGVRLAELLAVLSLGADLGMGQPMEHALRQCVIALRLGDRIGISEEERARLYFGALIAWVGCHVDAYEQAKWFGDDLALKDGFRRYDLSGPVPMLAMTRAYLGAGRPAGERARTVVAFAAHGRRDAGSMLANHWYAVDQLAEAVGLDEGVRTTLLQTFERWDGKGAPHGARGDGICLSSRIVNLADVLEVYHRSHGVTAALDMAQQRAGTQFDPALVDVVSREGEALFEGLDATTSWATVIADEPGLRHTLTEEELDGVLEAFVDFIDVKSPYTLGHSRGVAGLAAAAGERVGLAADDVRRLRRAALLHDLGRLGVSNAIWDKPGPLGAGEWERVRLHPYLTERMLHQSAALAPLAEIAVQHRERLDGSGYPKGLSGGAITRPARILGAVDAYRSMREPRPFRPPLSEEQAAAELQADARAGKLDAEAVAAVLAAAGHSVGRRREWPAGLTSREVDVLRLVARGLSSKQIATELVITPKTARNHIEHIYTKIDASSRVAASLFATEHGLI